MPNKTVQKALDWVDSIRHSEGGFSENEKKLIALADEVNRLTKVENLVRKFVSAYAGAKASQLGTGHAQQFYQRVRALVGQQS